MKKTAIILMLISIFSKIFGFARDISLSFFYGASNISDVYLISITIPSVIFGFIGAGITTGYIPMYSKISQISGEEKSNDFTNNLTNILLILCTLMMGLGLIFTSQIVKIFASGFEGETLQLAITFTRISLSGIYVTGLIYIFNGFLQVKGNYIVPALVTFPMNFLIIVSIFFSSKLNLLILAVGSVLALFSQLLFLIPFLYKNGYKYRFTLQLKDEHIKKMAFIAIPVIIGSSVNQINVLVDRTLASQISTGGISALNYANRLNNFVFGIVVLSISSVMFPMIAKMAAENNIKGLKNSLAEAIGGVNLLVIPATIGALFFAEPIVNLLFGRGAFDENAISMTSSALFFYSFGMIGFGLREILSRAFYSLQDTKTPMINASIAMILNIVLNIVLSQFLGIGGLALATSVSAIFCTLLLFISLRKRIGSFGMGKISKSFLKILFSSLVMGCISRIFYLYLLDNISNESLSLIIAIGTGLIIYALGIIILKVDEIDVLVKAIKNKKNASLDN
ncbi:murein biosynthesis integral membrane protein MurJ [Alkalicella caledoniensis]|uniref:Probable lipid II flippase MurJ n=2 Tax=Alkalicella caledoniensis TaxID=2731377 RepID=A0A7G9W3Z6_ALKCA|nr:murein biosynthesis integral membrane protein MurJ [Alkalicella caledoniensis]QNO13408.1 murein biosynthesis integral membrane protein MurJ [Alkalicella caledoniensis]